MLKMEQLSFFEKASYNTINTIQYLGSKKELLHWIVPFIEDGTENKEVVLDLFAGTGSLGYALKHRNRIFSNDVQGYSYVINKALLLATNYSDIESIKLVYKDYYDYNYNKLSFLLSDVIEKEKYFLDNDDLSLHENYSEWCEQTPFRFSNKKYKTDGEFSQLHNLIKDVDVLKCEINLMYTSYFSNAYFGISQCIQIDSIKFVIDHMPEDLKNIALTALMSAMSYSVTSTTHFAQYLKVKNEKNYKDIRTKRKIDLTLLFWNKLDYLLSELKRNNEYNINNKVFNEDFRSVLKSESVKKGNVSLVYADPPYFKEHYSRYYHLIESLVAYDYPELTFNPRINDVTVGRYPKNRIISDFGKKSFAPKAFSDLARLTSNLGVFGKCKMYETAALFVNHLPTSNFSSS